MKWLEALCKWNDARGGRYTIPKKGSPEHAEVCELMRGGSQASGYVKLLYAKHVNKKTPDDYDPVARPKKSARTFNPKKIGKPSEYIAEKYGIDEEAEALRKEAKQAAKALPKASAATAPVAPAAKSKGDIRSFLKPKGGAKPKRKAYTAAEAAKDKKALGIKTGKKDDKKLPVKESGQISVMMRIGNHVMVAEPQPAVIKVKGDLSTLKSEFDYPTSGYTGFENVPKETTKAQASRKFSAEETKVRPLSELFMTKPSKGLVEEQLMGKGCWWDRELQEF